MGKILVVVVVVVVVVMSYHLASALVPGSYHVSWDQTFNLGRCQDYQVLNNQKFRMVSSRVMLNLPEIEVFIRDLVVPSGN